MQPVLFRTLSLGVAIAAASSSAFAATLDGGFPASVCNRLNRGETPT